MTRHHRDHLAPRPDLIPPAERARRAARVLAHRARVARELAALGIAGVDPRSGAADTPLCACGNRLPCGGKYRECYECRKGR